MHPRSVWSRGAWRVITAMLLHPVAAQAAAGNESLSGIWRISGPGHLLTPTDGPIAFTSKGRQAYQKNIAAAKKADFSFDTAKSRCASPGVPRLALTPAPFRIWVRPTVVVFQYQWNRLLRTVDVAGRELKAPFGGAAVGLSHGRWDGDTLVIRTDDIIGQTLLDDAVPHDEDLVVDERLHLRDPDTLVDDVTITDPGYFRRSWHTQVTYRRQADQAFIEDVCLDRLDAGQVTLSSAVGKRQ